MQFFGPLCSFSLRSDVCWMYSVRHQLHSLSMTITVYILSNNVGRVGVDRGVEFRVCWARTSCHWDGSCTRHRSVTSYSWAYTGEERPRGLCSPLCWASCYQWLERETIPSLYTRLSREHHCPPDIRLCAVLTTCLFYNIILFQHNYAAIRLRLWVTLLI